MPLHLKKKFKEKAPPKYFDLTPSSGKLMPGQSMDIKVKFTPAEEVRTYVHLFVSYNIIYVRVRMYIYLCVYVYVCTYTYLHLCVYVHVCNSSIRLATVTSFHCQSTRTQMLATA